MDGGAGGADEFGQPCQFSGGAVGVETRVQPLRHLVQFQLQRHAVQHKQILIACLGTLSSLKNRER